MQNGESKAPVVIMTCSLAPHAVQYNTQNEPNREKHALDVCTESMLSPQDLSTSCGRRCGQSHLFSN